MKLFRRFWSSKVSLILLIIFIFAVIGYFTKGINLTPLLAIGALYIVFSVNERGKVMEKLKEDCPSIIGLGYGDYKHFTSTFSKIVGIIILIGTLFVLGIVGYKFIF